MENAFFDFSLEKFKNGQKLDLKVQKWPEIENFEKKICAFISLLLLTSKIAENILNKIPQNFWKIRIFYFGL